MTLQLTQAEREQLCNALLFAIVKLQPKSDVERTMLAAWQALGLKLTERAA